MHSGDVAQSVRALPCHGRGREFESRRPRQISKDLGPIWHVTSRYKKVQVQILTLLGWAGQQVLGQEEAPGLRGPLLLLELNAADTLPISNRERYGVCRY